jgi:hypothetical protein
MKFWCFFFHRQMWTTTPNGLDWFSRCQKCRRHWHSAGNPIMDDFDTAVAILVGALIFLLGVIFIFS